MGTDESVISDFFTSIALSCTLTANYGSYSSCSTASSASLSAGQLIAFGAFNFSSLADFQNARFMVSFTCQ
jgi:hypothetical protein